MVSKDRLISEVEEYAAPFKGSESPYGWYVGITSQPERRLFQDHKVNRDDGAWIYGKANSNAEARQVEEYFLERGFEGGPGGGKEDALYIYAYRITLFTQE